MFKNINKFLTERIYFPDGKSSERASNAILRTIKSYNQKNFKSDIG